MRLLAKPHHQPVANMRRRPYAEKSYRLLLRGRVSWSVHHSVLRKSRVLARLCDQAEPEDDTLDLHHLAEGIAHIIVHYLYTGVYQSLEERDLSPDERKIVKFRSWDSELRQPLDKPCPLLR